MNTLPVYAEVGSYLQQVGGECPPGWVQMNSLRPDDEGQILHTAQPDGVWAISENTRKAMASDIEREWQTSEMQVIANQLLAIEEGADDALPGTRSQWLAYRTKVRLWHESVDHPDISKRPNRPD